MTGPVPEAEPVHEHGHAAEPRHVAGPAGPRPGSRAGDGNRRRALDEVFGEVVPRVGSDERGPETAGPGPDGDAWYLENRPPHHDR